MAEYREFKSDEYCIVVDHQPTNNLRGPWVVQFHTSPLGPKTSQGFTTQEMELSSATEVRNYFNENIAYKEAWHWLRARGYAGKIEFNKRLV